MHAVFVLVSIYYKRDVGKVLLQKNTQTLIRIFKCEFCVTFTAPILAVLMTGYHH